MTRYLLLGANGFLGRQVRQAIVATGTAYLLAVSGHDELPAETPACHWRQVDLVRASVDEVADLFDYSKPDVVINCVGCTSGIGGGTGSGQRLGGPEAPGGADRDPTLSP